MRVKIVQLIAGLGLCLGLAAPFSASAQGTGATAKQSIETRFGDYELVSPKLLRTALDNSEDLVLINVHIPYEGELPETDTSVPFDKLAQQRAQLPQDKTTKIAVYCMSGRMSAIAARTLLKLGYTDVTDLRGGMIAWQRAGFPLASR